MAETTVLLQQVRVLQQQVESLQGLQTVVEEQRAVITELRALLDVRKAQVGPVSLTLRKEPEEGWRVIAGRRKGKAESSVPSVTETRNSFSVLEDQCSRDSEKTDETILSSRKVVVVGDSQVRGLG